MPSGCIEFTGSTIRGYGQLRVNGKMQYAHRAMWELMVGPIPPGLTIDHLCKNPTCVNVEHLEVVTQGVNTLRGSGPPALNASKTHCDKGHEFTEANTYIFDGRRYCRACGRERQRDRRRSP